MSIDWSRLRAVVLESDDWGLCAWSPDEAAHRELAVLPAFRGAAGRRYGGSTLESAADVRQLASLLGEFRGADGFAPVWQANTVMAAPDYARLHAPEFACEALPTLAHPHAPSRWARPGLWEEIDAARESGVWWPELHGLHHLPESAWLRALREGAPDARRAFELQSPVCEAVASSGEFDVSEPLAVRRRNLEQAVAHFRARFGRSPESFCPPDYRCDAEVDRGALRLEIHTIQGRPERPVPPLTRLFHIFARYRFPDIEGGMFYMPPRIAFEPGAAADSRRLGTDAAFRRIREAWARAQPAVVSTHRANFVQIDPARSVSGLAQLRELLERLANAGAVFLTDAELTTLLRRGWSVRPLGAHGAVVRHYGGPTEPLRFEAPPGTTRVTVRVGRGVVERVTFEQGMVEVIGARGELRVEWGPS